jgi:hypothetical protein
MIWMFILGAFLGFGLGLVIMSLWIIASLSDERLAPSEAEGPALSSAEEPALSLPKGLEE